MEEKKLQWNVYIHSWRNGIQVHNIFDHWRFYEQLCKLRKKYLKRTAFDFETFMKEVKSWMMYYYWSKIEWEISINEPFPKPKGEDSDGIKIDVYEQVRINWDNFKEYLLNNYKLIKMPKKVEDK